jgi:F-type H+-transporting ATPase subunit b
MLQIDPGLIVWTAVTFVILLVILRVTAWKPLLGALTQREQTIADAIEKAEKAREQAEKMLAENTRRLAQVEQEAQKIIKVGKEAADKARMELLEKSHQDARRIVEQAKAEIQREKEAALTLLRDEVADLAVKAASKIIDEHLDEERHRKLVDKFIRELPKN